MMNQGKHLNKSGLIHILEMTEKMNHKNPNKI